MEQLILHLIGDYVTQTNWMAVNKTRAAFPAWAHALVYSFPFLLLTRHAPNPSIAGFTILMTHFLIDRYRLARYLVFAKNWTSEPNLKWADCSVTGYPSEVPLWLSMWLLFIADNTLHLAINYSALRWL